MIKDKITNFISKTAKGRRRIALASIAAIIVLLATLAPIHVTYIPDTGNAVLTIGQGKYTITIGNLVAAQEADYTCDGTADDVEFQQALDALPSIGGQLFIYAGSYNWTASTTVTRAIDDVSVIGVGAAVYFDGDGSTPIFTAGGDRWIFTNFRTDTGGVSTGATSDWMELNVTLGGTYYPLRTDGINIENHSSLHGVGATDTVFPTDPNADRFLMWDDDPGQLSWEDAGDGDVSGPASSTDNAIVRFDGASGKTIQDYTSNAPTVSDTGDMNIDGDLDVENIVVAGNVDGRDVSADGTKLDGIEAEADVTDPTNVDAAGAVMESDYNATSFLYATADNTPQPKTPAEVLAILSGQADATFFWNDQSLSALKALVMTAEAELTIADGAITVTQFRHTVDTEGDAGSDDLATINGGASASIIVLRAENDGRTVVVKHNTGNIWLLGGADITLDDVEDGILLIWDATNSMWFSVGGAGGGGAGSVATDTIWEAQGDLVYGTGDNSATVLPIGYEGDFLRVNNASAPYWDTPGIAHTNPVVIDDADAADDDYAKFTASGLEGRSYDEVLSDLSGEATSAFDWNEQTLTNWGVESGSTLDTSPITGQLFLHTPTGRKILYQYEGANWKPLAALGAATVYVDNTDGTDDLEHGIGVDSDAFKTIQYAIDCFNIPGGSVSIYANAETYSENLNLQTRNTGTTLEGTLTTTASLEATGGNIGSGSTPPQVTGTFTGNQYDNKLIEFTSGANNGLIFVVGLTTTTTLYLVGGPLAAAPQSGDTYDIKDWGTVINSATNTGGSGTATISKIKVNNTSGNGATCFDSRMNVYYCNIANSGNAGIAIDDAYVQVKHSVVQVTASGYRMGIDIGFGNGDIYMSRIVGYGGANGIGIRLGNNCVGVIRSCEILGFDYDVHATKNGSADFYTPYCTSFIHDGDTYGQRAETGAQIFPTATYITYGTKLDGTADANGTDESADATSYGYIGS